MHRSKFSRYIQTLRTCGFSIRAAIAGIVAAILIPAFALGAWLTFTAASAHRDQLERETIRQSREMMAFVDGEITNAKNLLTIMANSHFLQTGDIESFNALVRSVSLTFDAHFVLRKVDMERQTVNTLLPSGAPMPVGMVPERRELEDRVLSTGQTLISNILPSPIGKYHIVIMVAPVWRDDTIAYTLAFVIPVEKFIRLLQMHENRPDRALVMFDRDGAIMAQSAPEQNRIRWRQPVSRYFRETVKGDIGHGNDFFDAPYFWSWNKSKITGWTIFAGISHAGREIPVQQAMITYLTGGGVLLFGALSGAFAFGNRLSRSLGAFGIERKPTIEEFDKLFYTVPVAELILGSNHNVLLANAKTERLFGYRREELIGHPVEMLFSERLDFSAEQPISETINGHTILGCRKGGSLFPVEIGFNSITIGVYDYVRVSVADITTRKLAQEQLAAATAERDNLRLRLMQAQEQERLRLAQELHDQTGQSLTAAMLELKAMEPDIAESGWGRLHALQAQLEKLSKTLHHVAWELRPASINELGLASALAEYVSMWSAQSGIDADFHCGDAQLEALGDDIRTTLYRLVQEALTNVAKHAVVASSVSVIVNRAAAILQLTIEDNGRGFNASTLATTRRGAGLGLAGMRERLSLVGGSLEVESSPGYGTTIYARIPLDRKRAAA